MQAHIKSDFGGKVIADGKKMFVNAFLLLFDAQTKIDFIQVLASVIIETTFQDV